MDSNGENQQLENWKHTEPEIRQRANSQTVIKRGFCVFCTFVWMWLLRSDCSRKAEGQTRQTAGVNYVHYGDAIDSSSIEVSQLQQIKGRWRSH